MNTRFVGRLDLSTEEYMDLIERKTAVLFGGCCELAGILSGVDAASERALREYGLHIGLAFQIVDDMLDFTGDPRILGKPTVSDLREGKATLPVLDLLRTGPARGRELVSTLVAGDTDEDASGELIALLHESGALDRAEARARLHAELAIRQLDAFPVGPARRALIGVPDLLISRNR